MRAILPPGGAGGSEVNTKFKVVKVVGKGSYGTVYKVQRLSDGQAYALKEMDVRSMNQAEREDAANEIRLLASVQHPNVISYNEAFLDGNKLCIIMDFAPDGDLARVIKKFQSERKPMPEELVWKYFIQICNGLLALHRMKILHRDIKPGNIMIMPNDIAKIGDLGIAKVLSKTAAAKTQIGTPHYMPPEIWKNQPYGFSSDSWAMGCLLYEMMTLKVPFEARNIQELRNKVLRGVYPPPPVGGSQGYSRELAAIVTACLDLRPEKRPGMEDILNMPAVRSRLHMIDGKVRNAPPSTSGASVMLDTIKVPRNIHMIKGKLPPAQYKSEMDSVEEDEMQELRQPPPRSAPRSAPRLPDMPPAAQRPAPAAPQPAMLPRVAQQPLPAALQPAPGGPRIDPVLAQMQQKAAMIDNIYAVYNNPAKRPPPVQVGGGDMYGGAAAAAAAAAAAGRPWYAQPKVGAAAAAAPVPSATPISESRSAYGAFYHSPGSAAVAAARAMHANGGGGGGNPYDNVLGGEPRYKGHYAPGGGMVGGGVDPAAYGARGGNWPAAKLAPIAQQRQQQQQAPPPQPQRQRAPTSKPPPWNYGVNKTPVAAGRPRGGAPPAWRAGGGGGFGADAGLQGHPVARYPPMQWSPPRLH